MQYYGDGPSYMANKKTLTALVPRNLVGFAPGNTKGIDNLSAAADEGRTDDVFGPSSTWPNEDLSGRTHPVTAAEYKPAHGGYPTAERSMSREYHPIYFDAVRLAQALGQIANDWQSKAWKLETTLRNYRLAASDIERAKIAMVLGGLWREHNKEAQTMIDIEEKIHTIDQA